MRMRKNGTVFKVVRIVHDTTSPSGFILTSTIAPVITFVKHKDRTPGKLYSIGAWTEATPFFLEAGYGLLAYDTYDHAYEYLKALEVYGAVLKCIGNNIRTEKEMPVQLIGAWWLKDNLEDACRPSASPYWGKGAVMVDRIMPTVFMHGGSPLIRR